nr:MULTISPECIES: bifunctional ornithine acetyltransferase/N-acetylglutamate synthase [Nostoc]
MSLRTFLIFICINHFLAKVTRVCFHPDKLCYSIHHLPTFCISLKREPLYAQAKKVAKAIVNSPLVKTAVYGADPNWGRVAMAIGKCENEQQINPERVVIRFDNVRVYPDTLTAENLEDLRQIMSKDKVDIHVSLNISDGEASATVWGCDLSEGYIEINGKYST